MCRVNIRSPNPNSFFTHFMRKLHYINRPSIASHVVSHPVQRSVQIPKLHQNPKNFVNKNGFLSERENKNCNGNPQQNRNVLHKNAKDWIRRAKVTGYRVNVEHNMMLKIRKYKSPGWLPLQLVDKASPPVKLVGVKKELKPIRMKKV